jgi:5-hydroxyisourate hydrolase
MSPLTTHVLDTAKGCPAQGLKVILASRNVDGSFQTISEGVTNADGRITNLIEKSQFRRGTYRLTFDTGSYHAGQGFFPYVDVVFEVKNPDQHHHVPILLSPFGFSTYRGS